MFLGGETQPPVRSMQSGTGGMGIIAMRTKPTSMIISLQHMGLMSCMMISSATLLPKIGMRSHGSTCSLMQEHSILY